MDRETAYKESQRLAAKGKTPKTCTICECVYPEGVGAGEFVSCPSCNGRTSNSIPYNDKDRLIIGRLKSVGKLTIGIFALSALAIFVSLFMSLSWALGEGAAFLVAGLAAAVVVGIGLIAAVLYFAMAEIVRSLQSIESRL